MSSNDTYPVIDLAEEERSLVRDLVSSAQALRTDPPDWPYGLYFVRSRSRFGVLGRSVEAEVFWEQFENDRNLLATEYGPYEDSSFFMLVVDHETSEVAGSLRVIEPSLAGMKTLEDIAALPGWGKCIDDILVFHNLDVPVSQFWDVATLAVRKRWRASYFGAMASLALYHGVFVGAAISGTQIVIAALDDVVADLMREFGTPWQRICDLPSISYLDSPSTSALLLDMRGLRSILGNASDLGHMICTGEGFEGFLSRPVFHLDKPPMCPADLEAHPAEANSSRS